ncbi:capsule biosynthesis protein [Caldimonas tepidiphila]|uniref:capsule biosynthesis protein n=1 Tax=Caldimonas tepidiphila TaxID=2315841 RepID=UPI000E5BC006|nr:capsular biosynthesis protein [Caldimonas tepidiphila]
MTGSFRTDSLPAIPPPPESFRALLGHQRPLLLQGPMGPFFDQLARFLLAQGKQVRKVHFNGGDELFYSATPAEPYTGTLKDWPHWLRQYLRSHAVDALVLFGQTRSLHLRARAVARELGVPVYVFEEGYFRPHYVTLERGGVNADSPLPRNPQAYRGRSSQEPASPRATNQRFGRMAWQAVSYYMATVARSRRYAHYSHHRPISPVAEGLRWVRGGWRKLWFRLKERGHASLCEAPLSGRWFLVPLQVHNDSQVTHHSPFGRVENFIEQVLASFAAHAPQDTLLVIKHHPMDRAYRDYGRLIARAADALGIGARVRYLHDAHLPTLLQHARGVVTINSTVGLQALYHRCPVVTLGEAFYAVRGLVHPGPLQSFWTQPGEVDAALFSRFKAHVIAQSQLNASFYGEVPALELDTEGSPALEALEALEAPEPLQRA